MVLPHNAPARRAITALIALALTLLSAPAASATGVTPTSARPASDPTGGPSSRLDPRGPHGAWAGYSLESTAAPAHPRLHQPAGSVPGMDVSGHQGAVDWPRAWAAGARFTYVKATEGTGFRNSHFAQQYNGSHRVGMIRGAYHFALPDRSSGAEQARYFLDNGGDWTPASRTLPGALDIEDNPYGEACYGLSPEEMSGWLAEFSDTYRQHTGRFPAIYTTTRWWNRCTGGNPHFGTNNPLWVARYNEHLGALPAGWAFHTIWQFNDSGKFPGDQNSFNGDPAQLAKFTS